MKYLLALLGLVLIIAFLGKYCDEIQDDPTKKDDK